MASEYDEGVLVGLLVGEGHFGGDGRQPHVTLRMHVRHEALFRWIQRTFPGGKLYGPYEHGGRRYYQWMARGAFLREELVPILRRRLSPHLDAYAHRRFEAMVDGFRRQLGVTEPTNGRGRQAPGPDATVPGRPTRAGEAAAPPSTPAT